MFLDNNFGVCDYDSPKNTQTDSQILVDLLLTFLGWQNLNIVQIGS